MKALFKRFGWLIIVASLLLGAAGAALAQDGLLADPINEGGFHIRLEMVASGLTAPNWGTSAPGHPDKLFVTDQDGILWMVDLPTGAKHVFLDVSDRLVPLGAFGPGTFDERGFLGVAFHPEYAENGLLYTYTSEPVDGPADFSTMPAGVSPNNQSVINEWQVLNPSDPSAVVDPSTRREILRIDEPQFNHNAGALNFGPDGKLYISLGDGGGRDDEPVGHGTGNAQNPANVLGSILRIDPLGSNSANGQYGIPADNPFTGQADKAGEVYAYGFRNPFRFSFDRQTGDLYAGDVGQDDIEEVDVVIAGGNYGWNLKEGSFCFDPAGSDPGFAFQADPCPNVPAGVDLIDPVAEYNTAESLENNIDGRAVVGGFVYRGNQIPFLEGRYVFGDFSVFTESGVNNAGRLFYLSKKNIVNGDNIKESKISEFRYVDREALGYALLGIGEDASGELYVLANSTGVPFGETGVILRIVAGP